MRLTNKNNDVPNDYGISYKTTKKCIQKLGQLEDIEDELGIDLKVFVNMIKGTKVFSKRNGEIYEQDFDYYDFHFYYQCFCLNISGSLEPMYYAKDYGKTWALTKEELTDGK